MYIVYDALLMRCNVDFVPFLVLLQYSFIFHENFDTYFMLAGHSRYDIVNLAGFQTETAHTSPMMKVLTGLSTRSHTHYVIT